MSCQLFDVFGVALGELVYLQQAVNEVRPKISPCIETLLVCLGQSNTILCILYSIFVNNLNWCVRVGIYPSCLILKSCFHVNTANL